MPSIDLLSYIFTNTRLPLAVQFSQWLQASPRFRLFAETYRDKIRKKVRNITDDAGCGDLGAELSVAYFLSLERRFTLEYEKYGTGKQRGPDFSVTYKTHIPFDVEVTRLRISISKEAPEPGKLINTICSKLEQLPPSIMNILALITDEGEYASDDLVAALRLLQEHADGKDDDYFVRRGFQGVRDFRRYYGRLSAIRMATRDTSLVLWLNPQAKHPLPSDLANILRR